MSQGTEFERKACFQVQEFLRLYGGDSVTQGGVSPAGDGRWVPLLEIFPRRPGPARSSALRQAVRRAHASGLLLGFEVAYHRDCVKAVQAEKVQAVEAAHHQPTQETRP